MNLTRQAQLFGSTLDQDDFKAFAILISPKCTYAIHGRVLTGPAQIASLYESNMNEGRKKFDVLEWGESEVEKVSDRQFIIHFSDYLEHKGKSITYKCCQRISFDATGLIERIEHIEKEGEAEKLAEFKKDVGLE